MPSQKELALSIKNILKTADLDSISAKQVRKQLEKEHKCDLTEHKKFIDKTIMDLIDEMGSGASEAEEAAPKEKVKKRLPSPPIKGSSNKKIKDEEDFTVKKSSVQSTPANTKKLLSAELVSESDEMSSGGSDSEFLSINKPASKSSTTNRKRIAKKSTNGANTDVASLAQTSNSRACKKNIRGSKTDVRVSPELAKIIGAEVLPMSEISLRLHQEALSRQLHEGSDKMYIICDEDFKALFKLERIRVSTLTNHCKKHIFKIEKEKSDKDKKKSGNSMYSKKIWLSPDLADILGHNHMSRHAVVKEMWAIIKARGLQDPKNKKFMLVDDHLMPVFKQKRVQTFGMLKYLTGHMCPDDDVYEYSTTYPEYIPATDNNANGTTEGS